MVLRFSPLIAALVVAPSSAQPPAVKPKPAWAIEYADKFCALVRMPANGKPGIIIRERPLSPYFQLIFLTPIRQPQKQVSGPIKFIRADGTSFDAYSMRAVDVAKQNMRVIETGMKLEEWERIQQDGVVRAVSPGRFDLSVPLPAIQKARGALATCTADLLKSWNIERSWAVDPKDVPDVRSLFTGDDYPSKMRDGGKQGSVVALLKISADGRVTSCTAKEREGDPQFETTTCQILTKRARFKPATDASGRAVESFYLAPPVRWMLGY